MNKQIPLFKVYSNPDALDTIRGSLESGYTGQGPVSQAFEDLMVKHFQNDYCTIVNSCTSAINLALSVIKQKCISRDDLPNVEVLSSVLGCWASTATILNHKFPIRWIDVDPKTLNGDLDDVYRKLTPKTRILLYVCWGGLPPDFDYLDEIRRRYHDMYGQELYVIIDAAHCWNSKFDNILVGNQPGYFTCYSFQSIKHLSMADGGLLICPDQQTHDVAQLIRWFGLDRRKSASMRCMQDIQYEETWKLQPNDILCALGLANYQGACDNVKIHQINAEFYNKELDSNFYSLLRCNQSWVKSSYWLYTILVEERQLFIEYMKAHGIETSPAHVRMDTHTAVSRYKSFLPGMDSIEHKYINIPVGYWVTSEDACYIADLIKSEGWLK